MRIITCDVCGQGGGTLVCTSKGYKHQVCPEKPVRSELVVARPKLVTLAEHAQDMKRRGV